jgi:hypothetical protein
MKKSRVIRNLRFMVERERDNIEYLKEADRNGPLGYAEARLATLEAVLVLLLPETPAEMNRMCDG